MRAVWSFPLFFLACGGRTLGDPVFDEAARGGALSSGGRAAGGTRNTGGAQPAGGRVSTGGNIGAGARGGTGGAVGAGGTSLGGGFGLGGQVSTGGRVGAGGQIGTGGLLGFGGVSATGGIGSGGAPFVDKSCVRFCDTVQGLCGALPDQPNQQCAVGCTQPLVSGSPACQVATRELLECMNRALATPQATCNSVSALVLLFCSEPLLKTNVCSQPPDMCTESMSASENLCERIRRCGASEYRTVCSGSGAASVCLCNVDGKLTSKMLFKGDPCKAALSSPCP